jgi:hypothetical protein
MTILIALSFMGCVSAALLTVQHYFLKDLTEPVASHPNR